ncbi:MAG: hypothetical protein KTR35_15895 [Gammaproteobacteria bacterium]|nr:hypothetical protein [Gammaproteobacteria bacterium]
MGPASNVGNTNSGLSSVDVGKRQREVDATQRSTATTPVLSSGSLLATLGEAARRKVFSEQEQQGRSSSAEGYSATADSAQRTKTTDPAAVQVQQQFQEDFAQAAQNHDEFHALMRQVYGENYDYAAAERMRQQSLEGDFSWMPTIVVVDQQTLNDHSGQQTGGVPGGAYSAETDTIYMSRELLESDPEAAYEIFCEEMGHAIDTRVNDADTAGDEGELFSALFRGEELTPEEIARINAENDHGTIIVDGQEIQVEYGSNPIKSVINAFTSIFKGIGGVFSNMASSFADFVSDVWSALKEVVIKILDSAIMNIIMTIISFIPGLNIIALVYRVIQAVRMIYMGIKHGSISMVLAGIATLASGAAKLGTAMGMSAKFVATASRIAQVASHMSKVYAAYSARDFGAAFSMLSGFLGDTNAGKFFGYVGRAYDVKNAIDDKNYLSAIGLGADLLGDLPGQEFDQFFESVGEHAETFEAISEAVRTGDFSKAAELLMSEYGADMGLSTEHRERAIRLAETFEKLAAVETLISDGDYTQAADILFDAADTFLPTEASREFLQKAGDMVSQLAKVAELVESGDYLTALDQGASLLGLDIDPTTQKRIDELMEFAEKAQAAKDLFEDGDYIGFMEATDALLGSPLGEQTKAALRELNSEVEKIVSIVEVFESGDVAAALGLTATYLGQPLSREASAQLEQLQSFIQKAEELKDAIDSNDVSKALDVLSELANIEMNPKTKARLEGVAQFAQRIETLKKAVDEKRYSTASRLAADIAASAGEASLAQSLQLLSVLLAGRIEPDFRTPPYIPEYATA